MSFVPYSSRNVRAFATHVLTFFSFHSTPNRSKSRLLCEIARLNETTIVPFQNRMEGSLFLDYLPMLCNMALHERAAEHAFQQVRDADPETAAAMTGRRRTTRRSGQSLEREHYFVSMRSCRENSVANEIGSELAEEVLHYTTIPVPKKNITIV